MKLVPSTVLPLVFLSSTNISQASSLLLSEAVVTPTSEEFFEIYNPTASPIDLTNYYVSDDDDYALLPGASGSGPAPAIGSSDFIVRFPAGAIIPAGGVQVIAFDAIGFSTAFATTPDYEIFGTDGGVTDMIATSLGGSAGLTNSGENLTLFFWDGAADLVSDVDMVNLGTPSSSNDIANKTGVSVDGPDGDALVSGYLTDAWTMPQQAGDPAFGSSTKRIRLEDGFQVSSGGNGLFGSDETTEDISQTWSLNDGAPNPGIVTIIPEPSTALLSMFGLLGLSVRRRRQG